MSESRRAIAACPVIAAAGWLVLLALAGCSRTHYRLHADREAYSILTHKAAGLPWAPPPDFQVTPDLRSRFFDPTPPDDPLLPLPAPQLYAYQLPDLPPRKPARFRGESPPAILPAPASGAATEGAVQPAAYQEPLTVADEPEPVPAFDGELEGDLEAGEQLTLAPIPREIWQSLPDRCLRRMFEFDTVRQEYQQTFGQPPPEALRDSSQRLSLEDVVDLARINSRQYQSQKEILYAAALRLSLARFEYDLKFVTSGNGTDVDYTHDRRGGVTENTLRLPTTLQGDKLLATGGDVLARFANRVVLTFNGNAGYTADVGSDLLFDVSQSVLQRDIILERLTQPERDLVYATRNYSRYRKELFRDLAVDYYRLLLTYRSIQIATQDYFQNLRGYNQAEAEYRAGRRPRFEVDQFEQQALSSRSDLISACNALERALDDLKLLIGLPTETRLNLNLIELEQITLRDEVTAAAERVRRARRNLLAERQQTSPEQSVLLNGAIDLVRRMLALRRRQERLTEQPFDRGPLVGLLAALLADETRLDLRFNQAVLAEEQAAMPPAPPLRVFQRSTETADAQLRLIECQTRLVARLPAGDGPARAAWDAVQTLRGRLDKLRQRLREAAVKRQLDQIPLLVQEITTLLGDIDKLSADVDQVLQTPRRTATEELQETVRQVDQLLAQSERVLAEKVGGLTPLEMEMDDAMLTALTLRFQLMNQREQLADSWREIKFAGDDLRSVLNLHATEQIRTRNGLNRPFDFTFDDSTTRLQLDFDAPLNRKAQRNEFRRRLIDYNVALRNLIQREDEIKLEVRNSLRQLEVDREQYQIAVASAALAYERVISTTLQLNLGIQSVTARDVWESQGAYTESLRRLAAAHIGYIERRIQFFLDLELLEVDGQGFWTQLYDEGLQPEPNYQLPDYGRPIYGELPAGTRPSHSIRRMLAVPPGETIIFEPAAP